MAFTKDPEASKPYYIDWTNELGTTEAISVSAWALTTDGSTDMSLFAESNTTAITRVFLSEGTAGSDYAITNTITADTTSHVEEKTIWIHVRER